MATEKVLRRNLGPLQIQLISLGGIIGSGYFLGVGATLAENGYAAVPAYLLGGLIVWLVAMAMGELAVAMPREGSFVSHASELMGPHWAAGVGWSYWFNWCAYLPSEMLAGGLLLNHYAPGMPVLAWAALFGAAILTVNLVNVRYFGQIESGLALLKIAAMAAVTGVALWVRTQGAAAPATEWTPPGQGFGFLAAMVLVLVNFQGTELITLSAAETRDPERAIPRAARNVALRTVGLYVLPLAALLAVFPWREAQVGRSVFAVMLERHGLAGAATAFDFVVITAALSCANSGLYGAARSLYGLAREGLAPRALGQLNDAGVPAHAILWTGALAVAFLPLYHFFEGSVFYTWLLSLSGFTGAICWISISACQLFYRGKNPTVRTSYRMPGFPYLSALSLALQGMCLAMLAFHPVLRTALILGVPAFLLPVAAVWLRGRAAGARLGNSQ